MTPKNLQKKVVAYLRTPINYPHPSHNIAEVQTNQSHVFLVGDYAYKLFKAIDRYRDNTTPEARLENALQEITANAPLAGDMYIQILAVLQDSQGEFYTVSADTHQEGAVDYLVQMHRFASEDLLYNRLFQNRLSAPDIHELGAHVARFHVNQQPSQPPASGSYTTFYTDFLSWIDRFAQKAECPHLKAMVLELKLPAQQRFESVRETLECRTQWRVLHGDLDFGNITSFRGKLVPFDAQVIFGGNRTNDPAKDVGYMLAPLYMNGRAGLARTLVDAYLSVACDPTMLDVLPLWAAYAAMVRGNSWHGRIRSATGPEAAQFEAFSYRYIKVAKRLLEDGLPTP